MHTSMSFVTGLVVVWVTVHALGLAAAWLVRLSAVRRWEGLLQLVFLGSLPLIALATVVGHHFCMNFWPLSALTLALMIVTAIVDFGPRSSVLTPLESGN